MSSLGFRFAASRLGFRRSQPARPVVSFLRGLRPRAPACFACGERNASARVPWRLVPLSLTARQLTGPNRRTRFRFVLRGSAAWRLAIPPFHAAFAAPLMDETGLGFASLHRG